MRKDVFADAERLRGEFCIRITGLVRARPAGTANANLASGPGRAAGRELEILNRSETPPFHHDEPVERRAAPEVSLSSTCVAT